MAKKNYEVSITEYHAAEDVAGSKLLFRIGNKKHLVDVGKRYKPGDEKEPIPFNAKTIDDLIYTHGHADHIGDTLKFVKAGFNGKIYSTKETADIAKLQLRQEASSPFIHNKMIKMGRISGPYKPIIYDSKDVNHTLDMFECFDGEQPGYPYEETIQLAKDTKMTFYDAGHIPGSAQILFEINGKRRMKLLTCYDLGRTDYKVLEHTVADIPIVRFPHKDFPKDIDYVVIESTYGDKVHTDLEESINTLYEAARDTGKQNGKLIIPAFSVMRTHILLNFLYRLDKQGKLPDNMKMYMSSPTAEKVNRIILRHAENMDDRAKKEFAEKDDNPFKFDKLTTLKKSQDMYHILKTGGKDCWGMIAASGMCDMGRVVPILEKTIPYKNNIVLLTGYAAPGTRSYQMVKGAKTLKFNKKEVPLNADVRRMGGLSGHADKAEMIKHLHNIKNPKKGEQFKGIFIKHGEKKSCHILKQRFIESGYDEDKVHVMKKGEKYNL